MSYLFSTWAVLWVEEDLLEKRQSEDDLLAWWLNQMDEETNQTALDGDQGARFGATL